MSFIRVGQQPSVKRKSAREREEDVVSLLKGGRDYTNKILGMQFPGSNPKLSFSINLPNQDIADIQQQQRSQTFNQIKDRFASDPGIDGRIETLRTTQDEPTATQDEPTASPIGFDQVKTQYMSDEPADDFNSIDGEKVFGEAIFTYNPKLAQNLRLYGYQILIGIIIFSSITKISIIGELAQPFIYIFSLIAGI